jgi:NADH:ubiquinone oxidoreductase subunit E
MSLEFSAEATKKIQALCERYPTKKPVVMAALHLAQKEHGHLSDDALQLVARTLDLPLAHVFGVATFYTMYRRTAGKFTIVEEECIAACANAPAVICGTQYYLDVTPDQVGRIVDELRAEPHPEGEIV